MCRFAAWSGPPRPLSSLTHDPPHSLLTQSWAPRRMLEARLNADGAGVAWYPDDGLDTPALYRTLHPLWSDESLASIAPRIRARRILAVVRSATPGLPVSRSSTPPFVQGAIAFAHNGYLEGFHQHFMRPMRERLGDAAYATVTGGTDSEHLFALVLEQAGFAPPTEALVDATRAAVRQCLQLARTKGVKAALNLLLTDGKALVAVRACEGGQAPSLFVREDDGVTIASEPLDEAVGWLPVEEYSLVVVGEGGRVERSPL